MNPRLRVVALLAIGAAAAFAALQLFPRAFPAIALDNKLTQSTALAAADSFLRAHDLADSVSHRAVEFRADHEVLTFVDLFAGGPDSVNALVRGKYAAPFDWAVRAFEPGNVHESHVTFAPDGRVTGFRRKLADADARPDIGADSAKALAHRVLTEWLGEAKENWTVAATSYQTKKPSDRTDRTVTFERTDRKVGDAPLRLDVVVGGDTPIEGRAYVHVPETFTRRYAEMRSANDLYAIIATVGAFILFGLGVWTIRRFAHHGLLRWRPALLAGAFIGVLVTGAAFNSLGAGWSTYDTAQPAAIFQTMLVAAAIASGVFTAGLVGLTLVAAEAANRTAFPDHLDWWKLPKSFGTREYAGQVLGGYVVALIAFAYVASFYMITRGFGWWVPSEILDDPNQIATSAPWLTGVAMSLQAGVWEEALFRVLPLSLLSLWIGKRPNRSAWMAAGVVGTALVFGFAHSNYPSWPPYSRGIEIFIDACFWAVLFLRFGAVVTMLAHFAYDLVLFSLFTATGSAIEYRIAAGIALIALLAPALLVAWRVIRQGGFVPLPDDARFGAWAKPTAPPPSAEPVVHDSVAPMSERSRQIALAAVAAALVTAVVIEREQVRGPAYTAAKDVVLRVADSVLTAKGITPDGWRRLVTTSSDTQPALSRFLREHEIDSMATLLARSYATPAWWIVRYVHSEGSLAERAPEWRVRLYPDGKPLDVRHIVPDSAPAESPPVDSVRRIAQRAMTAAGLDLAKFRESELDETPRPARRDVQITWIDTTVKLPAGANARAWVSVAGNEPLVVRRGIQLPEAFLRSDRSKQTRVIAMGGLLGAMIFGAMFGASFYVARKRQVLADDFVVRGGTKWIFIVILGASLFASSANQWPSALFGYDTATPWTNHITMQLILALVSPIAGAAVFAGIWNVMEMLRRRAGIVAWPSPANGFAVQDSIVAGLGLGALIELGSLTAGLFTDPGVPGVPRTSLDEWSPLLSPTLGLVSATVGKVALLTIPALVIVATAKTVRMRWIVFASTIVLSVAMLAPVADSVRVAPTNSLASVFALVRAAAIVAAVVHWGKRSSLTWIVAAIVSTAISDTHGVVTSVTNVERVSHAIAVVTALAGLTLLIRYAQNRVNGAAIPPAAPAFVTPDALQ